MGASTARIPNGMGQATGEESGVIGRRRMEVGDVVYLRQWKGCEPVVTPATVTAVNRYWADATTDGGGVVKLRRYTGLSSDRKEAFDSREEAMLGHLVRLLWCPGAPWTSDRQELLERAKKVSNVMRMLRDEGEKEGDA